MRDFLLNHADQALYLAFLVALLLYVAVENIRFNREAEKDKAEYEKLRDQWFTKKTVNDIGRVAGLVAAHNMNKQGKE